MRGVNTVRSKIPAERDLLGQLAVLVAMACIQWEVVNCISCSHSKKGLDMRNISFQCSILYIRDLPLRLTGVDR